MTTPRIARSRRTRAATVLALPVVPLRDVVVFPRAVLAVSVSDPCGMRAVETAAGADLDIFVVADLRPADVADAPLSPETLASVGTIAHIGQVLRLPDGTLHVWLQGRQRAQAVRFAAVDGYLTAEARLLSEEATLDLELEALVRLVRSLFERFAKLAPNVPEEATLAARNIESPSWLADFVAFSCDQLDIATRQELVQIVDPRQRLRRVAMLLAHHVEVLELRRKIEDEVHKVIEKAQREYHLREQFKAIRRELGEDDPEQAVVRQIRAQIEAAGMPPEVAERAARELDRLTHIPFASPETAVIRTYLDWLVSLPWQKETADDLDIVAAAKVLDADHYGLRKVKERILEYMAVRQLAAQRLRSPVLCFLGPPGVGKTSLGRSIARALGRRFVRLSLGGLRDEAEIRGHRRTYVGAMPGRIIQGLRTAGTRNPVFMLDELDKVGADFRGDPSAALLEALDPEHNHAFSDHFLEVPFDLARVLFIATANVLHTIPPALRDRLEIIELPGYTEDEKLHIARQFLLPRQRAQHGLSPHQLAIADRGLQAVIRSYTREAGVRDLERQIATLCRKAARRLTDPSRRGRLRVTATNLSRYLGAPRFIYGAAEEHDEVGVATGVAVTPTGGELISVEVNVMCGQGEPLLTGQLGEVMQESARAALSYVRGRAGDLGIAPTFFEQHVVHIHVPAGAVPKDGPSAGVTIITALVSALTGRAVARDLAMTGEITLRGRVLPVGGLKEKLLAAHRAGIATFVLPEENRRDLVDIPAHVLRRLRLVFVRDADEVLAVALRPAVARVGAAL
jgi:ATP-dependent Lon protease